MHDIAPWYILAMLGWLNRFAFETQAAHMTTCPTTNAIENDASELVFVAPRIDLSSICNPLGTPPSIMRGLKRIAACGSLNSSGEYLAQARHHLAHRFGIDETSFLCDTTVKSMVRIAARAFRPTAVGIVAPSPPAYTLGVREAGCIPIGISVPYGYATPDPDIAVASGAVFHAAVLANPNYPGSRLLPRPTLERYLEACDWVIVDESSIELTLGGESVIPLTQSYESLVVVRSFTAAFALPGVPVGFIVAHPKTIERMAPLGGASTPLSAMLCEEANKHHDFLEATRDVLESEIPWLQCMLSLVPGITIFPAEANYVLCRFLPLPPLRCVTKSASDLVERIGNEGSAITLLNGLRGLPDDSFFCVSVRTRKENERLVHALREAISTDDAK